MSGCASCLALGQENRTLRAAVRHLTRERDSLQAENARLRTQLEEARRAAKRQAAPFAKGPPKAKPQRPGRKPGGAYGPTAYRPIPAHVDEVVEAALPTHCPRCGQAAIEAEEVVETFETDIPLLRPHVTKFCVPRGRCRACGQRVKGRHPRQTSTAHGAAASHVGPRALALAAELNKGMGIPFGKVRRIFALAFQLPLSRAGVWHVVKRVGRTLAPTYAALVQSVRTAPRVVVDETGWKVAGRLEWLWVFVTPEATVYAILAGRGYAEAASILGEEYAGQLVRDGWGAYPRFRLATHATCHGHLLRRCHRLLETAQRGAARLPHAVKDLLQGALALRDRRDDGRLSPHGLATAIGRLRRRMDRLLTWRPTDAENRKLVAHLRRERAALFTFLEHPDVDATNWRAEQAIRPMVVTRKVWGGNRTRLGADVQQTVVSVLQTCRQRGHDFADVLVPLLRSPIATGARVLCPRWTAPLPRARLPS